MSHYFEGQTLEIIPGYINKSEDIHTIQSGVESAFIQLLNDEFGNFILSDEEDAFLLTPATNLINTSNENGDGSNWKNISTHHHKQPIEITKSSIRRVYLKIKNEGATTEIVTLEIRQPPFADSDGELYSTSTVTISPGENGIRYFSMELDHLPTGEYNLIIKRNNSDDNDQIYIMGDETASYSNRLAISPDAFEYDEVGGDLWFKVEYGNERTFDIVQGIAVINGEKTFTLDTHVTIDVASSLGRRKDLVCLDQDGQLIVLKGDVSNTPELPLHKYSEQYLKIAEITIYRNKSTAEQMTVNQDDTVGVYRTRSFKERIRRLEKFANYIYRYNSPERVKYNRTPPFMDDGLSYNIVLDTEDNAYKLSDINAMSLTWDFKSNSNINLDRTANVDRDYQAGRVTLAKTQDLGMSAYLQRLVPGIEFKDGVRYGNAVVSASYGNNSAKSTYPGVKFYSGMAEGYLVGFNNDEFMYSNVDKVACYIFKADGTLFEKSYYVQIAGKTDVVKYYNDNLQLLTPETQPSITAYGVHTNEWGVYFPFSGTKWIPQGWYHAIFVPIPSDKNKPAKITTQVWWDDSYPFTTSEGKTVDGKTGYKRFSAFQEYSSNYPFNPGKWVTKRNYWWMQHGCFVVKPSYLPEGTIQSSPIHAYTGIKQVTIDANFTLPEKTRYKLEVSNDAGTTFYEMHGKTFEFPNDSGREFVWKITLYTSDSKVTPVLKYVAAKGYGLKAELGLVEGDVLKGCLTTTPFNGEDIAREILTMAEEKFSHWEWVRVWVTGPETEEEEEETGQKVRITIEVSEDGVEWEEAKSNIKLEDLMNDSVDFSYYEGSYDEDEYNYFANVDPEIQSNKVLTESYNAAGTSCQTDNITVSASNGNNVITMIAGAEIGLVMYKKGPYDLSDFSQLELEVSSNTIIEDGDFELILSNADINAEYPFGQSRQVLSEENIVERHSFSYVEGDNDVQRLVFNLESDPEDLAGVTYIIIRLTYDSDYSSFILRLHNLYALKTVDYPFFEKYLRIKICMERPYEGISSPSVRKVGVIPIFD